MDRTALQIVLKALLFPYTAKRGKQRNRKHVYPNKNCERARAHTHTHTTALKNKHTLL